MQNAEFRMQTPNVAAPQCEGAALFAGRPIHIVFAFCILRSAF
jgi:hypothetical protein